MQLPRGCPRLSCHELEANRVRATIPSVIIDGLLVQRRQWR